MRDDCCKKVVANDMQSATTCHVLTKKIHHGMGPARRGGAFAPYKHFCAAKILAQAELISAEHLKKQGSPFDGTSNGRSAGTQAEDALEMKNIYQEFLPEQ